MKRIISSKLEDWATKKERKPLLLRGARQIGKSWSVKNLGKTFFKDNYVEINLEKNPSLHAVFKQDFVVSRILQELELVLNYTIKPGETLLFIDEIQECPEAILALRYFYEDQPNLHVIGAGSLLEFALSTISFPVGRIEQLQMYPMTFVEFLEATGKSKLANLIQQKPVQQSEIVLQQLKKSLRDYFIVGGMPECVKTFVATNSFIEVQKIQTDLLFTYQQDFYKYKPAIDVDCTNDVLLNSIQKIGQQIIYTKLSDRFSMPTIKKAFEALTNARLLHKVKNVSIAGLPLTTSGRQFKTVFLDIGLFVKFSGMNIENEFKHDSLLALFKGALAEQFIGQELVALQNELFYWARNEKNSTAEVDYVTVNKGKITPIEVKSSAKGALRSLHVLLENYKEIKDVYIFSEAPVGKQNEYNFIPIYYVSSFLKQTS